MLFLLGFTLLNDGLDYKIGENVTIVTDAMNVTTQSVTDVYGQYDDSSNKFGWILILLGGMGFLYSLYDL